ncbi:L-dopachrome tautomerase-related protein [Micromonospora sp. NPDC049559]|uniref:L-dopachrome tautomerase-related protein n=1 Tax=Micromonospora sp. NPDC049559 TaxID=3155923 RepID=UPI00342C8BAC
MAMPTRIDERLVPAYRSDRIWTAVTTTPEGRVFVGFPGADGAGPQVAEIVADGDLVPYPNAEFNSGDGAPADRFVRVNALRMGPDGHLWIVDAGAPEFGAPQVPGAARLIVVDVDTDSVVQVYDLGPVLREQSYVDDVRFNGDRAYLTDAGAPGLIVLELSTGWLRRVLEDHPSTIGRRPLRADGEVLRDASGGEVHLHSDQLEVSPDGRYLYYQPASGPLSRLETRWLDDPEVPAETLAQHVRTWVETPTAGGTAIDANGTIYFSDPDQRRILRIAPDRQVDTLVADARLTWPDAMWIDGAGTLWIPAAQLNRTAGFNAGRSAVEYPVWIYQLPIGARPAPNDHA